MHHIIYLTVLFTLGILFCGILWGLSNKNNSYYFLIFASQQSSQNLGIPKH